MNAPHRLLALAAALLLAGFMAGCSSDDADTSGSPSPSVVEPIELTTADTELGTILVDGNDMTLYLFTKDTKGSGESTCEDVCLERWPAVPAVGAGDGVDAALVSTLTRTDGTEQTVYNGWPLYYYAGDKVAGDMTGQGVDDVWWVVSPDGKAVKGTP